MIDQSTKLDSGGSWQRMVWGYGVPTFFIKAVFLEDGRFEYSEKEFASIKSRYRYVGFIDYHLPHGKQGQTDRTAAPL
jgi:hypothetical protein